MTLPESILTKKQTKTFRKDITYYGEPARMTVTTRYDDQCGNGHNTFAITANIFVEGRWSTGGCLHDEIAREFPELEPLIKWHLCSTDGPIHYIANTVYHVRNRDLDLARTSAIWPRAAKLQLTDDGLEERLIARLPALMEEFKRAVEGLGFVY